MSTKRPTAAHREATGTPLSGLPRPPRISIVVALGPHDDSPSAGLEWALAQASRRADVELVVVEETVPAAVKRHLAEIVDRIRVLHHNLTLGSRGALAAGLNAAKGEVVILTAPEAAPPDGAFEQLLSPFDEDPGVGFVQAASENGAPDVAPVLALRRGALESVGGPGALLGHDMEPGSHEEELDLVDRSLLERLRAARWREATTETCVAHPGRRPMGWSRDKAAQRQPLDPPYWVPVPVAISPRRGVNVVGLLEGACGIGDAARRYVEAFSKTSVPYATFAYHGHGSPHFPYEHHRGDRYAYDTNLFVINPDLLRYFGMIAGSELWKQRYTIGLWFWELETIPPRVLEALPLVNELWVSTRFLEQAFSACVDKPVRRIPLPVRRREGVPARTKSELGLPDRFTYLTIFDFGSLAVRKNGIGTVDAFCRAFDENEGPALVVKTMNAAGDPHAREAIERVAGGRRDVILLDGYVSDETVSDMIGRADCFVSLHRSEGFGLTPAEAMAWARPVVATGYSGNLDFMTEENSYLVPYSLSEVPPALGGVYPPGARWAEPDLEAAAAMLRAVYDHPEQATARALCGQADIRRENSNEAAARAIEARLREIAQRRQHKAA